MASRLLDRLTKVRARRMGKVYRVTRAPAPGAEDETKAPRFIALGGGAGWRKKAEAAAVEAERNSRNALPLLGPLSPAEPNATSQPVVSPGATGGDRGAA